MWLSETRWPKNLPKLESSFIKFCKKANTMYAFNNTRLHSFSFLIFCSIFARKKVLEFKPYFLILRINFKHSQNFFVSKKEFCKKNWEVQSILRKIFFQLLHFLIRMFFRLWGINKEIVCIFVYQVIRVNPCFIRYECL